MQRYYVQDFINGCLADYDSREGCDGCDHCGTDACGTYDTLAAAQDELQFLIDSWVDNHARAIHRTHDRAVIEFGDFGSQRILAIESIEVDHEVTAEDHATSEGHYVSDTHNYARGLAHDYGSIDAARVAAEAIVAQLLADLPNADLVASCNDHWQIDYARGSWRGTARVNAYTVTYYHE